jgi:hypothetical protein
VIARGRLLEVVDGCPIYAKASAADLDPLALAVGRRGRLSKDGPVYEVDRIGSGAAYLHKVFDPPQFKEWGDVEKRDDAIAKLLAYIAGGKDDGRLAVDLTREALHAARMVRRIAVASGPVEPGIATASRFVERVS